MGLRILALVTDAYGAGGGIAQYNRDLFEALAASAIVDEIVVVPRNGQVPEAGVPAKVSQMPARSGKAAFIWQTATACRHPARFDMVFCGHLYMLPLAVLAAKLNRAPLWLQVHGIDAWTRPGWLLRWAVGQTQFVTAVSRHTRRLFLSWANCLPENVRVLPNTVDPRFTPGPKSASLLDRYGLHGKKLLLTVSRLSSAERYKGHDNVIAAVAQLCNTHPDIVYIIAGDGDDRSRLEKLAGDLDVSARVRFVGYVPDEDLPDLYRSADIFVMPSSGEGFGIVFLQALACNIPVIGGDSDGSRDPLRDGEDGSLVSPNGLESLVKAIDAGLRNLEEDMAKSGAFCHENFQYFVKQLIEHNFQSLLKI